MNYVDGLNFYGVNVKEIPCIKGSGAPTTSTVGAVGCLYMDIDNGGLYKCIAVTDGSYTWTSIADGEEPQPQVTSGHVSIADNTYTMTLTLDDNSTSVNVIEVTDGLPAKITVDGVEIPFTWEEVTE